MSPRLASEGETPDRKLHACGEAQVKGFFMSLFIASTGLVMSPRFLAAHLPVLAAGVFLVVLGKGVLVPPPPPHPPT